jgi:hypothetical protein
MRTNEDVFELHIAVDDTQCVHALQHRQHRRRNVAHAILQSNT